MRRKPHIPQFKEKLYVICEGIGDKIYLDRIFSFYKSEYDIKVISSGGKDKIIDKLREILILYPYNEYFLFVDTDCDGKKAIEKYKIKMKQEEINYVERIYFVNPIIEYLYLLAKVDKHPTDFYTKNKYSKSFEKYFGIIEYTGSQKQYEEMAKQITRESFEKYLNKIKVDFHQIPSSSIVELLNKITKIK